jgi:ribosomal protein L35AE/L33A
MADGIMGRIDLAILTKEQAETLVKRNVCWLKKKEGEPVKPLKNEPKKDPAE